MTFKKCLCHSGLCGSVGWRIILYTERQLVRFWSRHMVVGLITIWVRVEASDQCFSLPKTNKQTNKKFVISQLECFQDSWILKYELDIINW